MAQCVQGSTGGGAEAQLSLSVNGTPVVHTTLAKSVRTFAWDVGDQVGLLASGAGSDVFYDNFTATSKCSGDLC
jgi:hypothetical protein